MIVLADGQFGRRVRERLRTEAIIWLTTVGADGTPQPNPVWFLWQQEGFLIYNRSDANRLAHIAARPKVSLNFDGDGRGGDIIVFAGEARRLDGQPPPHELRDYEEKYGEAMIRVAGSAKNFSADYPVALRIDVTRVRGH
ncbi:TIGR03667 family PPOX class F420-dependent oxidoreductase [Amycolatopsis pigmentata]|uniref:TIGR03667 family PPOX class F420-dependent oxidoreductase n=1 Tax=Amycolatopsis pigmentata TaxID=450801 RepID=A0ABW5FYV9_9PSEU